MASTTATTSGEFGTQRKTTSDASATAAGDVPLDRAELHRRVDRGPGCATPP